MNREAEPFGWPETMLLAAAIAALVLGPLTLALTLGGALLGSARLRPLLAGAVVGGLTATALLARRLLDELQTLALSLRTHELAASWPRLLALWLTTPALAPLLALALVAWQRLRHDPDPDTRAWQALDHRELTVVRRAARSDLDVPPGRGGSLFLGYQLGGEPLLPLVRGRAYLPLERLGHHLLVAGATGSGKTETVLRLVASLAHASDWRIIFIDGKGDRENAARFAGLVSAAGREVWHFPSEAYDGWRGDGPAIAARLLALVDFAESGGGAYYRDLAVNAVQLACRTPAGPPRSSLELLRRLSREALGELHPSGSRAAAELAGLSREALDGIRARYAAFFATVGTSLDGTTAFEEVDSAYLLLDGLALKHEAGYLARFLVEDFTHWVAVRKPRAQRVLLVVDEFSALASAGKSLVDVIERTRAFGVAAVLCPQVAEGMGSAEATARLIGSAQTLLLHAMPAPERFIAAAGARRIAETTHQLRNQTPTGAASMRSGRTLRVDPDEVRRLRVGQCFVIGSGRALKLQVARAPGLPAP